jgi:cation transport regulator
MPYRTNADLPLPLRTHLPPHAQDIYREAFNHADGAHSDDPRREQISHRIAWGAVKRSYVKVGGSWIATRQPLHWGEKLMVAIDPVRSGLALGSLATGSPAARSVPCSQTEYSNGRAE